MKITFAFERITQNNENNGFEKQLKNKNSIDVKRRKLFGSHTRFQV